MHSYTEAQELALVAAIRDHADGVFQSSRERWEAIAEGVEGCDAAECVQRYRDLLARFRAALKVGSGVGRLHTCRVELCILARG